VLRSAADPATAAEAPRLRSARAELVRKDALAQPARCRRCHWMVLVSMT